MKETYLHLDEAKLKSRAKKIWTNKKEMPQEERDRLEGKIKKMQDIQDIQSGINQLTLKKMSGLEFTKEDSTLLVELLNKSQRLQNKPEDFKLVQK